MTARRIGVLMGGESQERDEEKAALDRIEAWRAEGRMDVEANGRFVILRAPERIDNALLFLYVRDRLALGGPRVQLLCYPDRRGTDAQRTYKLRSHGGLDLELVYRQLRERVPEAHAGTSRAAPARLLCPGPDRRGDTGGSHPRRTLRDGFGRLHPRRAGRQRRPASRTSRAG